MSDAQRYGVWLHGLMEHLTDAVLGGEEELRRKLNIPVEQMPALWQHAQDLLNAPALARFFDARHYLSAANEVAYVNAAGQLRRMDRLVEFAGEVWVLDYKTGERSANQAAQMAEYRAAMQAIHPGKVVRCALIFANGELSEV